jgi:hypothetical protein
MSERAKATITIEWRDPLDDDEVGSWFVYVVGANDTNAAGHYFLNNPTYDTGCGWETPGQAVDAAMKWAKDRGMAPFPNFSISVSTAIGMVGR